jgi:hypothetical protein
MPLAYSSDLAWRVIWRIWGSGHWAEDLPRWLANQIADPVWGLAVSFHYVRTVWARYWQTGDVLTYQGQRQGPAPNLIFDVEQDILLLKSVLDHPRWQLKDHHGSLSNTATGQRMSYSALCAAAWRLHLSRKVCATLRPFCLPAPLPHLLECVLQKVRSLCYKGDRERALIWLADRFVSRLAARGCEVRFIPPYCWFLSPLDNGAYGRLVRWMQANAALCASRPIRDALEMAMQACLTVDDAWGFFTHCGYTREE